MDDRTDPNIRSARELEREAIDKSEDVEYSTELADQEDLTAAKRAEAADIRQEGGE